MSGGSLPVTGLGALTLGGVAGLGVLNVPLPMGVAAVAVATIAAGAVLVRMSFRRGRPATSR